MYKTFDTILGPLGDGHSIFEYVQEMSFKPNSRQQCQRLRIIHCISRQIFFIESANCLLFTVLRVNPRISWQEKNQFGESRSNSVLTSYFTLQRQNPNYITSACFFLSDSEVFAIFFIFFVSARPPPQPRPGKNILSTTITEDHSFLTPSALMQNLHTSKYIRMNTLTLTGIVTFMKKCPISTEPCVSPLWALVRLAVKTIAS